MESAKTRWSALVAHGPPEGNAAYGIEACAEMGPPGVIAFQFVIRGELSSIRLPPVLAPGRADGLWKHTCFEAFVNGAGAAGYHEFNFSTSRQWAVYQFDDYRAGMISPHLDVHPEISVRRADDRLELDASLHLDDLNGLPERGRLRIGLCAVIEDREGTLSYWALKHAAGAPDFHSSEGFVLEVQRR